MDSFWDTSTQWGSEKRNQTLLDMVRSMMRFASLLIYFWRYALEIACYVLNKVSSKSVTKIPYEIWIGCKPTLSHLRIWDYLAYIKYLQTDKLGPRFDKCKFIGYSKKLGDIISILLKNKKCLSALG